jgi:hypothetical protein
MSQTSLVVINQTPRIHNTEWNLQSHWWAGVRQSPARHTESKGACLLTCPLKRAHQYIVHHWLTLQINKIIKKSKLIIWIIRQLFPIILVQGPHSDPLWKKHCMSSKTIISGFQYLVKTTVFTVSRNSFHTGCSHLISMLLYVIIFQQVTYFFAVQTSPNMIRLIVKRYHNQETTEIVA